jgi:multiple sugar transport system permease protein
MLNSLIISLGATGIGVFFGVMSAYAISRYNQRGIALLIVLFMMIPYMVCLLPIYIMFRRMQLIDSFSGLILAHLIITVPQSVWILTGFIEGIPRQLEEAAVLDGCTKIGSFLRIILPLIRPGLAATAVLSFTLSWNNFNLALVLSRSKTRTAPLGVYHFVAYESIDWGGLSAAVILLVIPALFFALTAQKHLVRGLAIGGVSGT